MGRLMDMMARLGGHLIEMEVLEYALDGLEGKVRVRAEEHLRHCGMCRKAVREVMDMQDGLALLAVAPETPRGLVQRVLKGIERRRQARGEGAPPRA